MTGADRSAAPTGLRLTTAARTIGEGEAAMLSSIAWTRGPLHVDHLAAEASPFGAISLPGQATLLIVAGLWASSPLMSMLEQRGARMLALLGSEASYLLPVLVGDTIRAEIEVTECRPSRSKPGLAVMTMRQRVLNQRDEAVADVSDRVLCRLTGGGEAGTA